jgi:hypothetical protein
LKGALNAFVIEDTGVLIIDGRVDIQAKEIGFLLSGAPHTDEMKENLYDGIQEVLVDRYNFTYSRLGDLNLIHPNVALLSRGMMNESFVGNFSDWKSPYVTVEILEYAIEGEGNTLIAIYVSVGAVGTLLVVAIITSIVVIRKQRRSPTNVYKIDNIEEEGDEGKRLIMDSPLDNKDLIVSQQ